jgi:cell division protein ZapA (FtsZ GTPase activity inhibitor)
MEKIRSSEKLHLTIHGKHYQLQCGAEQKDHIIQLADEVNSRANDIAKTTPHANYLHILMMTCLHLADELYEARQELGKIHEKNLLNKEDVGAFLKLHADPQENFYSTEAIQKIIESIQNMSEKLDALK